MDLLTVRSLERPTGDASLRARLAAAGAGDAVLAGGTWLFSVPQPHLSGLVDLTTLGWTPLLADDDGLTVAATATLAQLAAFPARPDWPATALFAGCCDALVGSAKIRSVATVGGNICLALPAGPMITLAAALDARALVWSADGDRTVPVVDLVAGAARTTLGRGELLRSIHLPAAALRGRTALRKAARTPLGRSAALLAGRRDPDGALTLAVTASLPRPAVLRYAEVPPADRLDADVDALAATAGGWFDDPHGSPDWRRAVTRHLAAGIRADLEADAWS